MKRTKKRMALCLTLIGFWLIFIWGNSCLPGQISSALSAWVRKLLWFLPEGPQSGHGLLRKIAHFTEFACLGASLAWLFAMLRKKFPYSLLCGFLVACTDECIQCFIPDRGPAIRDVLIDTAGAAVGIGLCLAVAAINKRIKNNKHLEETKL